MSHKTVWRIAGAILIVLALINVAAQFAVLDPSEGVAVPPNAEIDPDVETVDPLQDELIEDVGGLTSPTGIAVIVVSMMFIIIAIGLIGGAPWGVPAQLALGADITFKVINMISQGLVGDALIDMLPAIILIVIEAALIVVLYRYRVTDATDFDTKRATASQRETNREVS